MLVKHGVVLWGVLFWAVLTSCAQAAELLSAEQIVQALSANEDNGPMARAFRPKAKPDAQTRICDSALVSRLVAQTGQRGEELTRDLYIESKPKVDLDIEFAYGEASLLPAGKRQLDALAQALAEPSMAKQRFVVAGHTDRKGEKEYNERLSCERALSARRYLVERHRLEAKRLIPMGFGFDTLKDPADPLAAVNRRVEIRLSSSE